MDGRPSIVIASFVAWIACCAVAAAGPPSGSRSVVWDSDGDGLADPVDSCPVVTFEFGFDAADCDAMDLDPSNDAQASCKARERVAQMLVAGGAYVQHIAFAVVKDGVPFFADAFSYAGGGQFVHDPSGIHRLYRIGSTSKPVTAVAAKVLEEQGVLSFDDFVDAEDGSRVPVDGECSLRNLLTHRGAFTTDYGALHLYCYPGDLAAFWKEGDDRISPRYDSAVYGNLGGGYSYSAFNYSLAGAYLANRTGTSFATLLQTHVFDPASMCTASLDGARAVTTPIGSAPAVATGPSMHVGPYINFQSRTDGRCGDNFYSSDDVPGDPYTWQYYRLDEADAEARDPAGGVLASVVDMAHFARALLDSYHQPGGLVSQAGIRDLWAAVTDLQCAPACPYHAYYGTGFFTDSLPNEPVTQVGHGGSRPGLASAFILRPEDDLAVSILANGDLSTVALSHLAKTILDDFTE